MQGNKTVTIRDVAAAAGVSLATASRVVNGNGYTSENSRNKVQNAIKQLGYKPNGLARSLKLKKTDTIGLMITDIINPFYAHLADGVQDCARRLGYYVILCATDEDERLETEYLKVLMEKRAAGVIAVPTGSNLPMWREALELGLKVVLVDREIAGLSDVDLILVDNQQGAYQATKHLLDLGHRRIGLINGPETTTTGRQRLAGYIRALEDIGLIPDPELMENGTFKKESGIEAAQRLLSLDKPPTAIFATNNMLAESALFVLRECNLAIPEDISLIVFDDVPWTSLTNPSISVVRQPTSQLGCLAMQQIARHLSAAAQEHPVPHQQIVFPPKLILRNSCAAPKTVL